VPDHLLKSKPDSQHSRFHFEHFLVSPCLQLCKLTFLSFGLHLHDLCDLPEFSQVQLALFCHNVAPLSGVL
jgi:hypothetical protein